MAKTEDAERIERQRIFGENLERLRKQKNLSRKELAEAIGVTENSMSAYALGRRSPTIDRLFSLAKVLDVTMAELLGEAPAVEDKKVFRYRVQHAAKLIQAADFIPSISSREEPVILIGAFREFIRTKDEVTLAPSTVIKFKNVDDFVNAVEQIELDAVQRECDFKTALIDTTKT